MNKKIFIAAIACIGMTGVGARMYGQQSLQNNGMEFRKEAVSNIGSVAMVMSARPTAVAGIASELPGMLGLSDKNTFEQFSSKTDELGIQHDGYQQFFEGVAVEDGVILVHSAKGMIRSINGRVAHLANMYILPAIDQNEATGNATLYLDIIKATRHYPAQLVITSLSEEDNNYALAFKVRVDGYASDGRVKMASAYIDAHSGKLLKQVSLLRHADVERVAHTMYSGSTKIMVDSTAEGYRLRDNTRRIETYDAGGAELTERGSLYFENPRDYYTTEEEWGEHPAIMSVRLEKVQNDMLKDLGMQNGGRFVVSFIARDNGSDMEPATWPDVKMTQSTTMRLPVTTSNIYVFPLGAAYGGGFGKYNLRSNSLSDSVYFPINYTAAGTFPWSDADGNEGSYEISMEKNPALDAHWGMQKTHDYFLEIFNRNSYDGKGSVLRNYINGIWPMSLTQNNAAALPAPYFSMVYGLGDGVVMKPVVALDVMGHEFTHMVTETNGHGGLNYRGESGALNESFSDIFGTCIEFYARPERADWNIGEDVALYGAGYMRSMSNPKNTSYPDTYRGRFWMDTDDLTQDNGGVHINSSVQNKWFYLLCEGGSGRNDKGDDYTVTGIGMAKAEQIAYRNLVNYLSPSARFYDAYKGSLLATGDLFGDTSSVYQSVKDAWFAVGLTDADSVLAVDNLLPAFSGISLFPNPAGRQVTITSEREQAIAVSFVNTLGTSLLDFTVSKGINNIDISHLPRGMYVVRYRLDDRFYTHKLSVL